VRAVYGAAGTAIERAREGEGPTLLEVKTYRHHGHFEGDPDRYRDDDDRRMTRDQDAVLRLHGELVAAGDASGPELEALRAELEAAVDAAVEYARASPFPDPSEVGRYVYPEPLAAVEAR